MQDKDTVARFLECCVTYRERRSGLLRMVRLTDEEITGTEPRGIIEKYFSLSQCHDQPADITLGAEMKVGDNVLCLHTLF